jgi:hypothetical protein
MTAEAVGFAPADTVPGALGGAYGRKTEAGRGSL